MCFFEIIVGWGTATKLNKQTHRSLFSCCIVFSVDKSFPGPAEADDHRGGGRDLTRDGQAGGVLHKKEGHQVGWLCAGGRPLRRGRQGVVSNCESAETSIMIS